VKLSGEVQNIFDAVAETFRGPSGPILEEFSFMLKAIEKKHASRIPTITTGTRKEYTCSTNHTRVNHAPIKS